MVAARTSNQEDPHRNSHVQSLQVQVLPGDKKGTPCVPFCSGINGIGNGVHNRQGMTLTGSIQGIDFEYLLFASITNRKKRSFGVLEQSHISIQQAAAFYEVGHQAISWQKIRQSHHGNVHWKQPHPGYSPGFDPVKNQSACLKHR